MGKDVTADDVSFNVNAITRMAHESTKNGRISKDAAILVAHQEELRIKEKFRLAEIIAESAGRKTVQEGDVRIVNTMLEADLPA